MNTRHFIINKVRYKIETVNQLQVSNSWTMFPERNSSLSQSTSLRLTSTHALASLDQRWFPRDNGTVGLPEACPWSEKCLHRDRLLIRVLDTFLDSNRFDMVHLLWAWEHLMIKLVPRALEIVGIWAGNG